jgi:ABC-type uncharacterized transport system
MKIPSRSDGWRRLAIASAILLSTLVALFLYNRSVEKVPTLPVAMMSSVGLQWGEADMGAIAAGQAEPTVVFSRLSARYRVTMIDDLQTLYKTKAQLLILVQPRRLGPAELVALDNWIRHGGRALIFADPALQWPSDYPLGDMRRPLFTSMLNPLFTHWGVELALPMNSQAEKLETVDVEGQKINVLSRGIWIAAKPNQSAGCVIDPTEFIADCKVGQGRAVLLADADLLHETLWNSALLGRNQMAWVEDIADALVRNEPTRSR